MKNENLPEELRNNIMDIASPEHCLLTTEWKTPDFMSIPMFLTEGYIDHQESRAYHGQLNFDHLYYSANSSVRFSGLPPLTPAVPPYGLKTS